MTVYIETGKGRDEATARADFLKKAADRYGVGVDDISVRSGQYIPPANGVDSGSYRGTFALLREPPKPEEKKDDDKPKRTRRSTAPTSRSTAAGSGPSLVKRVVDLGNPFD